VSPHTTSTGHVPPQQPAVAGVAATRSTCSHAVLGIGDGGCRLWCFPGALRVRSGSGQQVGHRAGGVGTGDSQAAAPCLLVAFAMCELARCGASQRPGNWETGDRTSAVKCTRVLWTESATAHHVSHQQRLNSITAAISKYQVVVDTSNDRRIRACWPALRCYTQPPPPAPAPPPQHYHMPLLACRQ
jgi:hypothetical protein